MNEFADILCAVKKTQLFLLQDEQQSTVTQPGEIGYVDRDSGFNDFEFGKFHSSWSETDTSACHYFYKSDITGSILPTLKKLK